ncbi:TetR/AcrR family transcriptional regulator [Streptomyces roseofulvus]|uniref:TetR/AcrR family transcriptional regulator n=2 Tax=Streptomyces TaxID=1883 RepID=A0ABU4K019_9ACTN|nr:TetR/AcrR family transcriptional regulator [Streptomyces roseolus]MDX2291038.1 TetR/AcrR family transcriptional regulator [Streptomyces roseolus]
MTPRSTERGTYHHGDLRQAVLTAALDVIAADGPGALSLRDLARRAGVSHAAPAHHFGDRTGLLTAIAAQGFGLLADALAGGASLADRGRRYVRFAADHPAHFQVMFAPALLRADDPDLTAARERAGAELRAGVTVPAGRDARATGIAAWSLAHGFATLYLTHNVDDAVGALPPEEYFASLTGFLTGDRETGTDGPTD